ncbi:hypothetical protein E8E12_003224 [Didymella heteroderae]|uniref:Uncharacterized protein n=1 Tax=Didymella heteroderae TaxID=1769908 RepID=A0A9P4WKC0_9PLEO|nr:hypothetical protein E8E12_003224 [Didymella heteroderae]
MMAVHSLTDTSEIHLHDLPPELEVQYSPIDMNGPFEAVTAQESDHQASGNAMNMLDEHQHTLPIDGRLQALYDKYRTSYAFPISTHSAHMQHASDLAASLLQRHYPTSQQYRVETCALGSIAKYGVNFMLKDDHEPDSDTDLPRSTKQKTAQRKKKAMYADPVWHTIDPENLAAFVVRKGTAEVVEGVQTLVWRAHTHLVIILDDLTTFPRWSRENLNHRGDVLSDLSGVLGGLQRGHGMLFFGPRLELYSYDADDANKPVKPRTNPDWRMDMRTSNLAEVDEVLRGFVAQEPVYKDGR